jgi:hypothetical protein
VNNDRPLGRRVATVAVVGLGVIVALAGVGIIRDECELACGTAADQALRESMGYVGLVLGVSSIALAFNGRRALATAASLVGAAACLAAFVEGLSHLSQLS